jgi:dTDP-4-amino-4,6-dideoxygalactose transaminase
MAYFRNFGHDGYENFEGVGINGKNSEFHAAMGLVNLKYLNQIFEKRAEQSLRYKELLATLHVKFPKIQRIEKYNYSYFPILFPTESSLLNSMKLLQDNGIFSRRYFYPGLNTLDYTKGVTPISDSLSSKVLCLPLYHSLTVEEQRMIVRLLLRVQNNPQKS